MQVSRGALLRICRRRVGWSQPRLAEAVGVDQSTISRYEREEIPVPDDVMLRAGLALGAVELLQVAGAGPFAVVFDDDVATALDWIEEESQEAIEALRRIARAVRRGESPKVEDAEQVVDLIPALSTVMGALHRAGVDLTAAVQRHQQKLQQRYGGHKPAMAVA